MGSRQWHINGHVRAVSLDIDISQASRRTLVIFGNSICMGYLDPWKKTIPEKDTECGLVLTQWAPFAMSVVALRLNHCQVMHHLQIKTKTWSKCHTIEVRDAHWPWNGLQRKGCYLCGVGRLVISPFESPSTLYSVLYSNQNTCKLKLKRVSPCNRTTPYSVRSRCNLVSIASTL